MLHPYQIFYIHQSLSGVSLLYLNTCLNVIAQNFIGTEIIASCHTCIAFYNRAVISINLCRLMNALLQNEASL